MLKMGSSASNAQIESSESEIFKKVSIFRGKQVELFLEVLVKTLIYCFYGSFFHFAHGIVHYGS